MYYRFRLIRDSWHASTLKYATCIHPCTCYIWYIFIFVSARLDPNKNLKGVPSSPGHNARRGVLPQGLPAHSPRPQARAFHACALQHPPQHRLVRLGCSGLRVLLPLDKIGQSEIVQLDKIGQSEIVQLDKIGQSEVVRRC